MPYKIAILVGSLRAESINRKIARSICAIRSDGLECEMVEIGDLPLYNEEIDKPGKRPEEYDRFREKVRSADGVLFVTPEYNRGIPGGLKNAIDVGSRPYGKSAFDGKPAAVITASPGAIGGFGANHQIRQAAVFLNMPVMQQPEAYLGGVTADRFDENDCLKDGPLKEFVTKIAHAFHDWVDVIVNARPALADTPQERSKDSADTKKEPADA